MSVTDEKSRFLTLDQVAERFQLSRRTIERLVAADIMPSVRVGGSRRVSADELDQWIHTDAGEFSSSPAVPAEHGETFESGQSSSAPLAGEIER